MKMLDLFRTATRKTICEGRTCDDCHKIYMYEGCPYEEKNREIIAEFVHRVCKAITERQLEETFDWEMSEEELIDLIMECN